MKREFNEDTLKQCRDIEINCRDLKIAEKSNYVATQVNLVTTEAGRSRRQVMLNLLQQRC